MLVVLLMAMTTVAALADDSPRGRREPAAPRPAFTNSIGMAFAKVPAGEFLMGAIPADPDANVEEKPRHEVRITKPFWLGTTEVTIGQYRKFVEATGYRTEAEHDGLGGWGWDADARKFVGLDPAYNWRDPGWKQSDAHPVVNLTWDDAAAFCAWLSKQEHRAYRLPTGAEWEYACRAGTTTLFACGDDPECLAAIGNIADATARAELFPSWTETIKASDGHVFTAPVASYRPNAWGLFDMQGNVWEWCADWFDAKYYGKSPREDPPGPAAAVGFPTREIRGGGWSSVPRYARASNRPGRTPDARYHYLGFRVATSDPPP